MVNKYERILNIMNITTFCYTKDQVCLMNLLRQLWVEHVLWTRFFIISTIEDLKDLNDVTNRLLQNPGDFARVLSAYYDPQIVSAFQQLFTEHLLIAAELVQAAKKNDEKAVMDARQKWYANADQIAYFLASINPYWDKNEWRRLLYDHLAMTEQEAVLRLNGKFQEDIQNFDSIQNEAMAMADYMFCGLANYRNL